MVEKRRFDGRSPEAWRIKQLEAQYRIELGEVSAIPAVMQMIRRAAELVMLSEKLRAKMIRDDADADAGTDFERLLRLEGVTARALDRMRALAADVRAEQPKQTIADLVASRRIDCGEDRREALTPARTRTAPSPRRRTGGRGTDGSGASYRPTSTPDEEDGA
jgi:hypothetical protein